MDTAYKKIDLSSASSKNALHIFADFSSSFIFAAASGLAFSNEVNCLIRYVNLLSSVFDAVAVVAAAGCSSPSAISTGVAF